MTNGYIDLRSDTVTRPTEEMRKAMASAEVGDDVYGEDPTINRLQDMAAEVLGKEAALYFPSGTMANQAAVNVHTQPGEEVICEASCHIYNFEMATMASFSGVLPRLVHGDHGVMDPSDVEAAVQPDIYYMARSAMLAVENSHNLAGGTVSSVERCRELCKTARNHGLKSHLDGARIFNAAAALQVDASSIAEPFDSIMFCISKGLAAPVGSLLCGSTRFIERARAVRKMLGGGMRQAGIIAAAGIVALEDMTGLMAEDNRRAGKLAEALASSPYFDVELDWVRTNIVMARVRAPLKAGQVAEHLKEKGVLCHALTDDSLRFVTHYHVDDEAIGRAIEVLKGPF